MGQKNTKKIPPSSPPSPSGLSGTHHDGAKQTITGHLPGVHRATTCILSSGHKTRGDVNPTGAGLVTPPQDSVFVHEVHTGSVVQALPVLVGRDIPRLAQISPTQVFATGAFSVFRYPEHENVQQASRSGKQAVSLPFAEGACAPVADFGFDSVMCTDVLSRRLFLGRGARVFSYRILDEVEEQQQQLAASKPSCIMPKYLGTIALPTRPLWFAVLPQTDPDALFVSLRNKTGVFRIDLQSEATSFSCGLSTPWIMHGFVDKSSLVVGVRSSQKVQLWDPRAGFVACLVEDNKEPLHTTSNLEDFTVRNGRHQVVVCFTSGKCGVLDVRNTKTALANFKAHLDGFTKDVIDVFDPGLDMFVTGGGDQRVRAWNSSGKMHWECKTNRYNYGTCSMSSDLDHLYGREVEVPEDRDDEDKRTTFLLATAVQSIVCRWEEEGCVSLYQSLLVMTTS